MSLAGRIESFPLPEVLRLLARSHKTGCLRVEGGQVAGRLYFSDGRITYGSTREGDALGDGVVAAGLMGHRAWLQVERRELTIPEALAESRSHHDLTRFVTELVIDVTFRIERYGQGDFEFEDGVAPPYETGQLIEVDEVLAETEVRVSQWHDIERVIPGVTFRLRMAPELTGERDVMITGDAWRMLAALHGVGSISDVAERLGTNDFQVGKVLAQLVRDRMVEIVDDVAQGAYFYGEEARPKAESEESWEPAWDGEEGEGEAGERGGLIVIEEPEPKSPDEGNGERGRFRRRRGPGSVNIGED